MNLCVYDNKQNKTFFKKPVFRINERGLWPIYLKKKNGSRNSEIIVLSADSKCISLEILYF